MIKNNGTGKIGAQELAAIVGPEKDLRWDDFEILEPIISETMEWLTDARVWNGDPPQNFLDVPPIVEEIIVEALTKAFEAGLFEVQALCRAFLLAPHEEEYPVKYLPKD